MLVPTENKAFREGLSNRTLDCCAKLTDASQGAVRWQCWTEDGSHLIVIFFKDSYLGVGVDEIPDEAAHNIKVIAMDDKDRTDIPFDEIKEFMNWRHDDDTLFGDK